MVIKDAAPTKNHREAHGMTQSELCAGICDPSTLSRLERGRQTPGRDTGTVIRIAFSSRRLRWAGG